MDFLVIDGVQKFIHCLDISHGSVLTRVGRSDQTHNVGMQGSNAFILASSTRNQFHWKSFVLALNAEPLLQTMSFEVEVDFLLLVPQDLRRSRFSAIFSCVVLSSWHGGKTEAVFPNHGLCRRLVRQQGRTGRVRLLAFLEHQL